MVDLNEIYDQIRYKLTNGSRGITNVVMHHWCWGDISTADIPGAFMQADMIGNVHVKLKKRLLSYWQKFIQSNWKLYSHGEWKIAMYVKLCKALYGRLKAALHFWQTLSEKLLKWGFEVNFMAGALPTRWSIANNAQYFGMLMISKYHMWMIIL